MDLKFFALNEFRCRCLGCQRLGADPPRMDGDFLHALDLARARSLVPFVITSGYRCPGRNLAVGGVPDSAHVKGLAADIACPDSHHRYQILTALWSVGLTRMGIGKDFVHVDADDSKPQEVFWVY